MKYDILGVNVDNATMDEAVATLSGWLGDKGAHIGRGMHVDPRDRGGFSCVFNRQKEVCESRVARAKTH